MQLTLKRVGLLLALAAVIGAQVHMWIEFRPFAAASNQSQGDPFRDSRRGPSGHMCPICLGGTLAIPSIMPALWLTSEASPLEIRARLLYPSAPQGKLNSPRAPPLA